MVWKVRRAHTWEDEVQQRDGREPGHTRWTPLPCPHCCESSTHTLAVAVSCPQGRAATPVPASPTLSAVSVALAALTLFCKQSTVVQLPSACPQRLRLPPCTTWLVPPCGSCPRHHLLQQTLQHHKPLCQTPASVSFLALTAM